MNNSKAFYEGRIRFAMEQHTFVQREQLLGMVLCAAMGDRSITVSDMLSLSSQVEAAHQKSLEENYRETWSK